MNGPERAALDAAQVAVHDAVLAGGHHLVLGAPGTGRTTTAVETFLAWAAEHDPERALFLVPTRRRAGELRDAISRRLGRTTGQVLVRTPASLAFSLLRLDAVGHGEPAPTLITGPDQDQVLSELIEGHLEGAGAAPDWPATVPPETRRLRAFRDELRDLLMRAAEAGLDGPGLAAQGREHGRPEWVAAGELLREYAEVTRLGELTPDRGARYDAAAIVDSAVRLYQAGPEPDEPAGGVFGRFDLVVADDYQDATLATARLLGALAHDGARLALFAEPDIAVQTFRGAVPALVHTATLPEGSQEGAFGARVHTLHEVYRHTGALRRAIATLTRTLPPVAGVGRRDDGLHRPTAPRGTPYQPRFDLDLGPEPAAAPPTPPTPEPPVPPAGGRAPDLVVLPTAPQEIAYVARRLREEHLRRGVPWSRMAVVVRSSAQIGAIRRGLRTAGVPLAVAAPDRPLRDEPAVRPLLAALAALAPGARAPGESEPEREPGLLIADGLHPDAALVLLTSGFGGLDAVGVRTLRRALRHRARLAGVEAASDDLLVRALVDPSVRADLPVAVRRAPEAVARVLEAGRAELDGGGATEEVLWAMWEATGLAETWQRRALAGGLGADRADSDLDAVVALFTAAEQFTDRTTGAGPRGFLEHLLTQDFPADTLAAHAAVLESVQVHTPASAAGREWDVVVVAGVQEDAWPDTRIRDTLLGAAELADIATRRHVALGAEADLDRFRMARRAVLADELRTFVAACSRARETLVVTAVLDTDARPSGFFEALLPAGAPLPATTRVEAPLDLRGLVGALRSRLRPGAPDATARAAAGMLIELAEQGVPGADPRDWPELLASSSTDPILPPGPPVPVSPSAVEKAIECPLHWLLTTHGGRRASTAAQNVGNLVHEIAAERPTGSHAELAAELDRRWPELGVPDTFLGRVERDRGEEMVRQLAGYIGERGFGVHTEIPFDVVVGRARIKGRVDRVEERPGGLHVVDLKTGRSAVSQDRANRHAQLGSYQVAVEAGAFDGIAPGPDGAPDRRSDGASLLYVAANKNPTVRGQAPLEQDADPRWAHELMQEAARTMSGTDFEARRNEICGYCAVRSSCPAQPEGARVVPGEDE